MKEKILLRIEADDLNQLRKIANREDRSLSAQIRQILKREINRQKSEQ